MKKPSSEIKRETTENVSKLISNFGQRIEEGTANADSFLTLDSIEQEWAKLRRDTDRIYTDMVSELIRNINEQELISKKKESGVSKESS